MFNDLLRGHPLASPYTLDPMARALGSGRLGAMHTDEGHEVVEVRGVSYRCVRWATGAHVHFEIFRADEQVPFGELVPRKDDASGDTAYVPRGHGSDEPKRLVLLEIIAELRKRKILAG